MGKCIKCGMEWEMAWYDNKPYEDDPSIVLCAWCQALQDAWYTKNKAEIRYWTRRYIRGARR